MDILEIENSIRSFCKEKNASAISALLLEKLGDLTNTDVFKVARIFCEHSDIDSFKVLMQHPTFDINRVIYTNTLATDAKAGLYKNVNMLKELVALGLNINYKDQNGDTLFIHALTSPQGDGKDVADYLLSFQTAETIRLTDNKGRMLFHLAAEMGYIEGLEKCLSLGFNIETFAKAKGSNCGDCYNYKGKNALHIACAFGQAHAVVFLLNHGANPNTDPEGWQNRNSLFFALDMEWYSKNTRMPQDEIDSSIASQNFILRQLVAAGANINAVCNYAAPLMSLFAQKYSDRIEASSSLESLAITMVELGASIKLENNWGIPLLHLACNKGFVALCDLLLAKGEDVNRKDPNGSSPLHYAVGKSNLALTKLLLEKHASMSIVDDMRVTVLDLAKQLGNRDILELLQNGGAKERVLSPYEITSKIREAYWNGKKDLIAKTLQDNLLAFQFDDDFVGDKHLGSFFEVACAICNFSDINAFKILSQHPQFDINMQVDGNTLATEKHSRLYYNVQMLQELISMGLNVAFRNKEGETIYTLALKLATEKPSIYSNGEQIERAAEVVNLLKDAQGEEDIYATDNAGRMQFHCAAEEGNTVILEDYLTKGFEIDTLTKDQDRNISYSFNYGGKAALHIACRFGKQEAVAFLLENSANPNAESSQGITPLFFALDVRWALDKAHSIPHEREIIEQRDYIIRELVKHGANVNQHIEGESPLLFLLQDDCFANGLPRYYEVLALTLISLGADANSANDLGETPLHFASRNQLYELCKQLFKKNVDINARDKSGSTPLHYAVKSRDTKLVLILLKKGAESSVVNNDGDTPLDIATKQGNTELVELLLGSA